MSSIPLSNLDSVLTSTDKAKGLPNEHYVSEAVFEEEKKATDLAALKKAQETLDAENLALDVEAREAETKAAAAATLPTTVNDSAAVSNCDNWIACKQILV